MAEDEKEQKKKLVCIIVIGVVILLYIFRFITEGKDKVTTMELNAMSYAEIAETLKELGIEGITDEMVAELEANSAQMPPEILFNKTATLLSSAGIGNFDYETWDWTPSSNSVYCFDVEIFNLEKMYTFFLQGVAAIGKGELDFTNIKEDLSEVDWEAGTGKRSVTFDWNEKTYTIEAEDMGDWFDMKVADELSKIIEAQGGSKKLYFTTDGYQACIIFYCDEAWAETFREKTGLPLEAD